MIFVATTAGACSGSPSSSGGSGIPDGVALQVDDWQLSRDDFLDELRQVEKNPRYVEARTLAGGHQQFTVFEPGTDQPDPLVAAEFLNERVSFRLAETELAKRNLTVTDTDRRQAIGLLGASLQRAQSQASSAGSTSTTMPSSPHSTGSGATPADSSGSDATQQLGQSVLDGFTGSYKQVLLDGLSSLVALQRSLNGGSDPESQLREVYEVAKDEACISHILIRASDNAGKPDPQTGQPIVASEAEYQSALVKATELRAKIVGGADFATVARESSADASKDRGGDLGCRPKGAYVAAFDDAVWSLPPNTVSNPVRTPFGYHLLLVREKRTKSFEEARPALEAALRAQQGEALQQWLTEAARAARVEVNSAFGTWDTSRGTVTPAGGGTDLTLSPLESTPPGTQVPGAPPPGATVVPTPTPAPPTTS